MEAPEIQGTKNQRLTGLRTLIGQKLLLTAAIAQLITMSLFVIITALFLYIWISLGPIIQPTLDPNPVEAFFLYRTAITRRISLIIIFSILAGITSYVWLKSRAHPVKHFGRIMAFAFLAIILAFVTMTIGTGVWFPDLLFILAFHFGSSFLTQPLWIWSREQALFIAYWILALLPTIFVFSGALLAISEKSV